MGEADITGLVGRIQGIEPQSATRLVAIDGRGGAGKSSLARRLAEYLENTTIVEVDDFWLPRDVRPDRQTVVNEPGSDYDWVRLRDQVIEPLRRGEPGRYQRYDWETDTLAEWHDVPVGGTVVVEGVFSLRQELAELYDLRVWVDTPLDVCLRRGIERDGEEHRDLWENEWMKAYERYAEDGAVERADVVVKGE